MAEWKTQVNYNPTFHAYTYGFVYQTGPEQNHVTGTDWGQNCEQNGYNGGPTQSHFPARSREESPPRSPEQQPESGHYYQDSGVVYIREAQTGRLVMAGQHRVGLDGGENCTRRTGSDSASDSEAHTSPGKYRNIGFSLLQQEKLRFLLQVLPWSPDFPQICFFQKWRQCLCYLFMLRHLAARKKNSTLIKLVL